VVSYYLRAVSQTPKAAIVILNWNGRKYLEQFMPSVLSTSWSNLEVVVADNGSSDDSIDFLKKQFPSVRIISFSNNFGFAKGYNEALKQVNADYYAILNSDVEVQPGWLDPMIRLLESDPTIASCQPKLLAYHNKKLFEYAGGAGGWLDAYGYPFARGRVFDICEEDNGQYNDQAPVFWTSGAAMLIRAKVFHEMKGFDEYFFAHQEEIDLCWRMQLSGYKLYSCPSSVVYHVGGGTLPRGNSKKTYLNFRNNQIMLFKNMPWREKWWKIPFRQMLDAVSATKGLLTGDGGYFIAIIRAHLAFVKWFFFRQKRSVFPVKRTGKLVGRYEGNIVWQHFAKGKKKFTEIIH
jgi:GT2 family glycosyltransferase